MGLRGSWRPQRQPSLAPETASNPTHRAAGIFLKTVAILWISSPVLRAVLLQERQKVGLRISIVRVVMEEARAVREAQGPHADSRQILLFLKMHKAVMARTKTSQVRSAIVTAH